MFKSHICSIINRVYVIELLHATKSLSRKSGNMVLVHTTIMSKS